MNRMRRHSKSFEIAAILRERITRRQYMAHSALPSMADLSAEFGVALMTVNRAIRQLSAENLVQCRRGSGVFVCRTRKRIALLEEPSKHFRDPGTTEINRIYYENVCRELEDSGAEVVPIAYSELCRRHFSPRLLDRCEGVLLSAQYNDPHSRDFMRDFSGPVVLYRHQGIEPEPYSQVYGDLQPGLAALFHRLPGAADKHYIVLSSNYRWKNFMTSAARFKVPADHIRKIDYDFALPGKLPQLEGYKFGMEVELTPDTVVFTTSDLVAFGVLEAFDKRNLKPGDYQLVSIDNLEGRGIRPFGHPRLTTVDHPKEEIVHRAVQLLMELVENHDAARHIIEIPCQLIVRESALLDLPAERRSEA